MLKRVIVQWLAFPTVGFCKIEKLGASWHLQRGEQLVETFTSSSSWFTNTIMLLVIIHHCAEQIQIHARSAPPQHAWQKDIAKGRRICNLGHSLVFFFRSARTSCRTFDVPSRPPVRNNFSWVHRWAVTLPSGLRYPSNRIFSESWWCQLSKFGRKYKYKDKYRDKYKYRDK